MIDESLPAARHVLEQYANNRVEADHGRLKARLRPMRGLKTIRSLRTISAGPAFVQNLRRGQLRSLPTWPSTIESASPSPNWHPRSDSRLSAASPADVPSWHPTQQRRQPSIMRHIEINRYRLQIFWR